MPVRLNGSTSGYVELKSPAVAGSTSLELPTDSIKPGLVLLNTSAFSAASSVSVNNCFSSLYSNYKILLSIYGSGTAYVGLKLRASSVDAASDYYDQTQYGQITSVGAERSGPKATGMHLSYTGTGSTSPSITSIDVFNPAIAVATSFVGTFNYGATTTLTIMSVSGYHNVATAYDGFSLVPDTGITITGTVSVYGYRNSL